FMIATDEDFSPYRVVATIDSGRYAGTEYTATSASGTPPVDADTTISGPTSFVGLGCEPVEPGDGVALIERGVCPFQTKLDNITAAGYDAGIVFNNSVGCDALVTMLAEGDIPFVFATRTAGLQLLDQDNLDCAATTPAPGSPSADTTIRAVFDGWGYVRLFRTDIPKTGGAGSIEQVDTYAIPESQSEDFAVGFGDLSVHEVAMDPDTPVGYLSYYSGGLRVVSYGAKGGLEEVGAFIDEGGNNFWGVEVHERDGEKYVLASDRDFGLYVLQYTP
ncbi:MAG: PA domain-containing protein, partial [Pseudonocardiaceae bacterium]